MKTLNPKCFGTIEKISGVFAAFSNWSNTRITPFSEEDVKKAIAESRFECRSFQDPSAEMELKTYFEELSSKNLPIEEKDTKLSEWARDFHIRRVAYLTVNPSHKPIEIKANCDVTDGLHRIMAAIVRGSESIQYIIVE